jgi:tetratricopeptide (TPR) repeat protein
VQAAIGGGALLFIILMAVVLGGGDDTEPAAALEDPDAGTIAVAVVVVDAAVIEPVADLPPDADLSETIDPVLPPDPKPEVVKKTPQQKAKALYLSGKSKFARGDLSGAKRDFNASLKLRPGYGPAHKLLAKLYEKAGVKSKALKNYKMYLKSSPRAADRVKIQSRIKQLGG